MSPKPVARQRIVPAIPHQLTVRRSKVIPAGKSDQQIPDDKAKSATPSVAEHKASARENGVEHGDARKYDKPVHLVNGAKDDEVKQTPIEKEPVAVEQLAEDKEPTEEKEPIEKKETAEKSTIAPKMEPVENKEISGVTAPPRRQQHYQDAQARPFVPKHQPRQSESLVFGGLQDSSSASPANPATAFMPPPPVPGVPTSMAPYDGYSAAQQYSSIVPPAPMAVMGPPQVNGHGFAHTNGTGAQLGSISSSPSHTPSMPLGDSAVVTPDAYTSHKLHAPHPSTFGMPPFDANVQHLVEFIASYWGQHEFADYVLEIHSGNQSSNPLMLPVHGIILARYPGLLKLVNSLPQTRTHSRAPIIHVPRSYSFQDATAFADAMRYIYGGSLIEPMHVFNKPASTPTSRMRYILSYLAAGHCFSAEAIVLHAYNIATRILSFNELEVVLFFAICGNCLTERCLYGPYADQMVWQALCLIVSNIFPDFVLDTSAPELLSLPRLPATPNSASASQSRPDSRSSSAFATSDAQRPMSSIRFGSATPSNSDISSPNYILSSVLLSLPFDFLRMVLEHDMLVGNLGIETLLSIAGEIVRERERRRVDACNSMQDQKNNLEGVLLMGESVSRDVTSTRLKLYCTRYG